MRQRRKNRHNAEDKQEHRDLKGVRYIVEVDRFLKIGGKFEVEMRTENLTEHLEGRSIIFPLKKVGVRSVILTIEKITVIEGSTFKVVRLKKTSMRKARRLLNGKSGWNRVGSVSRSLRKINPIRSAR